MKPDIKDELSAAVLEHRAAAPKRLGLAIITVSDTRTLETDTSGQRACELSEAAGHRVPHRSLVPDEAASLGEALHRALADPQVDAVVLNGGTGVARRDGTPDVVAPLLEVELQGFGELFRMLSFQQVGAAAMLSRALGGVVAGKPVFCLPGSTKAVELALTALILPELGHLVRELRR